MKKLLTILVLLLAVASQGWAVDAITTLYPLPHDVGNWNSLQIDYDLVSGIQSGDKITIYINKDDRNHNIQVQYEKPKESGEGNDWTGIGIDLATETEGEIYSITMTETAAGYFNETTKSKLILTGENYTVTKVTLTHDDTPKQLFPKTVINGWGNISISKDLFTNAVVNDIVKAEFNESVSSAELKFLYGWGSGEEYTITTDETSKIVSLTIASEEILNKLKGNDLLISPRSGNSVSIRDVKIVPTYQLSVSVENGKLYLGDTETEYTNNTRYESGSTVTLRAVANEGYIFEKWTKTGDDDWNASEAATTNPLTISGLNADWTLTASFIETPLSLSWEGTRALSETPVAVAASEFSSVTVGTKVQLTVNANGSMKVAIPAATEVVLFNGSVWSGAFYFEVTAENIEALKENGISITGSSTTLTKIETSNYTTGTVTLEGENLLPCGWSSNYASNTVTITGEWGARGWYVGDDKYNDKKCITVNFAENGVSAAGSLKMEYINAYGVLTSTETAIATTDTKVSLDIPSSDLVRIVQVYITSATANATYQLSSVEVEENGYTLTVTQPSEGGSIKIGENIADASKVYAAGTEITLTAVASDGYIFSKWQKDASDITETTNSLTVTMNADMTITASFIQGYIVTITSPDASKGSIAVSDGTNNLESGAGIAANTQLTLTATAQSGYKFINWTIGENKPSNNPYTFTPTSAVTIASEFEPIGTLGLSTMDYGWASYDTSTHIIDFTGTWGARGWYINSDAYNDKDKIVINFQGTEGSSTLHLYMDYIDTSNAIKTEQTDNTTATCSVSADANGEISLAIPSDVKEIKYIYLKMEGAAKIKLVSVSVTDKKTAQSLSTGSKRIVTGGVTISKTYFANVAAGDILKVAISDVADGATYTLKSAGDGGETTNWSSLGNVTTGEGQFTYTLTTDDVTKIVASGLFITGNGYTCGNIQIETAATINSEATHSDPTLTITPSDNGSITVKKDENAVSSGDKIGEGITLTLKAEPAEGYQFSKWTSPASLESATAETSIEMTSNDMTITAEFEAIPETVTALTAGEARTLFEDANGVAMSWNEICEKGAAWGAILEEREMFRITISSKTDAEWPKVTVRDASSTDKMDKLVNDITEFPYVAELTLSAKNVSALANGFRVSGDGVTITKVELYKPNKYTLTLSEPENGTVVIKKGETEVEAGQFEENTELTLTATPSEGYSFTKWTIGEVEFTENPLTLTMTADKTVTATFTANTPEQTSVNISLAELNEGWSSTYDAATKTITTEGEWAARGWYIGDDRYNGKGSITVKFNAVEFPVTLKMEYTNANDEAKDVSAGAAAGETEVVLDIPENVKTIEKVYITYQSAGTLTLTEATVNDKVVDNRTEKTLVENSQAIADGDVKINRGLFANAIAGDIIRIYGTPGEGAKIALEPSDYSGALDGANWAEFSTSPFELVLTDALLTTVKTKDLLIRGEKYTFIKAVLYSASAIGSTVYALKVTQPTAGGTIKLGETAAAASQDIAAGESVTLTASPAEGYHLDYWTKDDTNAGTESTLTFTMEADVTVTASFSNKSERVLKEESVAISEGDIKINRGLFANAVVGDIIRIYGTPGEGAKIALEPSDYSGALDGANWAEFTTSPFELVLTDALLTTVKAKDLLIRGEKYTFTKAVLYSASAIGSTVYALKVTQPTAGGTIKLGETAAAASQDIAAGESVTLTASPAEGYHLDYWTKDDTNAGTESTLTFTMESDVTVTASFSNKSERTLVENSQAIADGDVKINRGLFANAVVGDIIRIYGTPESGAKIALEPSDYSGALDGANWAEFSTSPFELVLTDALLTTVKAKDLLIRGENYTFTKAVLYSASAIGSTVYALKVTQPTAGGTIKLGETAAAASQDIAAGESVTLTASPAEGYHLDYWTKDDTNAGTESTLTFTMESDVTVTASFSNKSERVLKEESVAISEGDIKINRGLFTNAVAGDIIRIYGTPESGAKIALEPSDYSGALDGANWAEFSTSPFELVLTEALLTTVKTKDLLIRGENYTFTKAVLYTEKELGKEIIDVQKFTLTLSTPENGTVVIKKGNEEVKAGEFDENTELTLTATAAEGYEFTKWQKNGEDAGTEATLTVKMTADMTIAAVFSKKTEPIIDEETGETDLTEMTPQDPSTTSVEYNDEDQSITITTTEPYKAAQIWFNEPEKLAKGNVLIVDIAESGVNVTVTVKYTDGTESSMTSTAHAASARHAAAAGTKISVPLETGKDVQNIEVKNAEAGTITIQKMVVTTKNIFTDGVADLSMAKPQSNAIYDTSTYSLAVTKGWTGITITPLATEQVSGVELMLQFTSAAQVKVAVTYNEGEGPSVIMDEAAKYLQMTLDKTKTVKEIQIQPTAAGVVQFKSLAVNQTVSPAPDYVAPLEEGERRTLFESMEGTQLSWNDICQMAANYGAILEEREQIEVYISARTEDCEWPKVFIKDANGEECGTVAELSAVDLFPYMAKFKLTNEMVEQLRDGFSICGDGIIVTQVCLYKPAALKAGDIDVADLNGGYQSSYDATSKTITTTSRWAARGWDIGDNRYNNYDVVVVQFEAVEFPVTLRMEYVDMNGETKTLSQGASAGNTQVEIEIPDDIQQINYVYLMYENPGTLILTNAEALRSTYRTKTLNLADFEAISDGTTYDNKTFTMTSTADNGTIQLWLNSPIEGGEDLTLTLVNDAAKVSMLVGYTDGSQVSVESEGTTALLPLNHSKNIQKIMISIQTAGTVQFESIQMTQRILTFIPSVKTDIHYQQNDDSWYRLDGKRVSQPGRGIYIHNGKKIVIK